MTFDILTVFPYHLLTLFTKNMKENITELIPDWCDENFDVLARNVQIRKQSRFATVSEKNNKIVV